MVGTDTGPTVWLRSSWMTIGVRHDTQLPKGLLQSLMDCRRTVKLSRRLKGTAF
jgi:hypothetical protein